MPSLGWSAPRRARLLAPERPTDHGGVRAPDRDSPADHRRAVGDLTAVLSEGVGGDVVASARRAAHELLLAIEACDAEVAALSRRTTLRPTTSTTTPRAAAADRVRALCDEITRELARALDASTGVVPPPDALAPRPATPTPR